MKKSMKLLAWVLAVSMITTALPLNTAQVLASDGVHEVTPVKTESEAETYIIEGVTKKIYAKEGDNVNISADINISGNNTNITESQLTLGYQWYKYNFETNEYEIISGATSKTYSIDSFSGNEDYECIITDTTSNTANSQSAYTYIYVTSNTGLDITYEGSDEIELLNGESKRLQISGNINEDVPNKTITYKWYEYSYNYENDTESYNEVSTQSYLDITGDGRYHDYKAVVEDQYGNINWTWFYVEPFCSFYLNYENTVYVSPRHSTDLKVNYEINTSRGTTTTISSYEWYVYDETQSKYVKIDGANGDTYRVTPVKNMYFMCEVKDISGFLQTAYFSVNIDLGLKYKSQTNHRILSGNTRELHANISTDLSGCQMTYTWYKQNENNWDDYDIIVGATGNSYTTESLNRNARYMCEIKAEYNGYSQKAYLYFNVSISQYALNSRLMCNDFIPVGTAIGVNASCNNGNISYTWYNNKGEIIAKNVNSYTPSISGKYRVLVEVNESGGSECDEYSIIAYNNGGIITAGVPINVSTAEGECIAFAFTPNQSGAYNIASTGTADSYVTLFDSEGNALGSDDDNGINANFSLTYNLRAGNTYYYAISGYSMQNCSCVITLVNNVSCNHQNTSVRGARAATCVEAGYTGDVVCLDCNLVISNGSIIPAINHNLVIVNAKAATCTEAGYTGDKVCSVCNAVVEAGAVIPATGHTVTVVNTKAATMSADGYTGDKVCTVCNTTVEAGTAIAKIKSVSLKKTTLTYTGRNQKPVVVVKDRTGKTIPVANYTVTYSKDSKTVGVKTAKVTFKGNYRGTKKLTYTIVPKNASKLIVKAATKSINVSWKKQATQTTGYKIQYSTKKNFAGAKTITVKKNRTTKTTIKSLKKGTTYYVRICTYKTVNKKNICSAWSSAKKIKVTK